MNSSSSAVSVNSSVPSDLFGNATQDFIDAEDLQTPEAFVANWNGDDAVDQPANDEEMVLEDGMDEAIDQACAKMLGDISKRQEKEAANRKINIISDVIVHKSPAKLKQLLTIPRSVATTNKATFYTKRQQKVAQTPVEEVPSVTAASPKVARPPSPASSPQPSTSTAISPQPSTSAVKSPCKRLKLEHQQASTSFARPLSPVIKSRRNRKKTQKFTFKKTNDKHPVPAWIPEWFYDDDTKPTDDLAAPSSAGNQLYEDITPASAPNDAEPMEDATPIASAPDWLGDFTNSQQQKMTAVLQIKKDLGEKWQNSVSAADECQRKIDRMLEELQAHRNSADRYKRQLEQFNRFSDN